MPGVNRFLSQEADRNRVPAALLAGGLGSGKTTLLNALLRDPAMADTAVAINEFGAVPLDHLLIEAAPDHIVVLANGCLCCNLAGDMEAGMMRLFNRRTSGAMPSFARLVIELSGLADPAPIAQAILRNPVLSRALRLEAVITTVDAMFAPAQLGRSATARKQAALADQLVVTKVDLADHATIGRLTAELRQLNPLAPVLLVRDGVVAAARLLPPQFFDPTAPAPPHRSGLQAEAATPPDHAARMSAVSLITEGKLRWRPFEGWLKQVRLEHAEQVPRIKAILHVEGAAGPIVVHGVHHVLHPAIELACWPDADRQSRLVLIAENAAAEAIRASWVAALPGILAAAPP